MAKIRSDNKEIKSLLEELLALVIEEGGAAHKDLLIQCLEGNMVLRIAKPVRHSEIVLRVPSSCMPAVDDFNLEFDGLLLTARERPEAKYRITKAQARAMAIIVSLYNLGDKINAYSDYSPFVGFYHHTDLLEKLGNSFSVVNPLLESGLSLNALKLQAFLDSRLYHDHISDVFRLLPLIDFADHHSLADGFLIHEEVGSFDALSVRYSDVKGAGRSILVCYRQKDRLSSLLNYGFVDKTVNFAQSIPLEVILKDDFVFNIKAGFVDGNMMPQEKIYLAVPGFKFSKSHFDAYVPTMRGLKENTLEIHYCLIPKGKDLPVLKEVIAYQLKYFELRFSLSSGSILNVENINRIEQAIIDINLEYYCDLSACLSEVREDKDFLAAQMLKEVIDYQQAHVNNYSKKREKFSLSI